MYKKITSILLTVVILLGIVFTGVNTVSAETADETPVANTTEIPEGTPEEGTGQTPDEPSQEPTDQPSGLTTFTVSQPCIDLLKFWEGFCAKPYWDYGQYTVGYGTRCPDDKVAYYTQNGITEAEAEALLCTYLRQFESYLNNDLIKKYNLTLTQNQFDALLLLTYNCGPNWLYSESSSNLRKAVVAGVTGSELIDRFSRWCNAGGQIQTYLLRRRLCEVNIYLNGEYSQVVPESMGYVLYDANGGQTSTSVQGYDTVETAEIIPTPTYEGYVFAGWYTERTGGEKVTVLDAKVRNTRLYAHWTNKAGESTDSDEEIDGVKVTVDTQELLIRKGPDTSYAIVGSLFSGEQVVITETEVGGNYTWGKCSKGWICLKYTNYDAVIKDNEKEEDAGQVETPDLQEHKMGTVKVSSYLYIRQGPSTGYGIVGQLYNGDRVKILEQKVAGPMVWGKIENGWISMEYVELDPEAEPEPPVEEPEPEKYSYTLTYHANYEGAKPSITIDSESVADSLETAVVFKVDKNTFVREGYTFAGWATSAGGKAEYQADAEITLNKDNTSKDLYAIWTANAVEPEPEPPVEEPAPTVLKGKVKVNSLLIVRSGPDSSHKAVATLSNGTAVTILEQKTTGNMTWGKIASGWICMDYVVLDEVPEAPAETVKGTVNVSSFLRVRSQAGTNYTIVGYLYPKDRVEILEKKTVNGAVWGKISSGWIDLSYIILDEESSAPSEPEKPETVTKIVNTDCLRVRSQANTGSTIVGFLYYGAKVTITEQKTVNGTVWGRISNGWICMDYVK